MRKSILKTYLTTLSLMALISVNANAADLNTTSKMTVNIPAPTVSVQVPTEFNVHFNADGTNVIPSLTMRNTSSLNPVKLNTLQITGGAGTASSTQSFILTDKLEGNTRKLDSRYFTLKYCIDNSGSYVNFDTYKSVGTIGNNVATSTFGDSVTLAVGEEKSIDFEISRNLFTKAVINVKLMDIVLVFDVLDF